MTFLLVGISDSEAFTAAVIGGFFFCFIQDMQLLEGHCPPWHPWTDTQMELTPLPSGQQAFPPILMHNRGEFFLCDAKFPSGW